MIKTEEIENKYKDLIGVPFYHCGKDPKRGLDCWGLCLSIYKRLGIKLPDPLNEYPDDKKENLNYFVDNYCNYFDKVDNPKLWDLVLIGRIPEHIGIYLYDDYILQAIYKIGVAKTRIKNYYVYGYFRLKDEIKETLYLHDNL